MGKSDWSWRLLFVAMLTAATVVLAACGGGSGSSSTAGSTESQEGGEATTAAAKESSSGSGEAASIIAPYVGKASPIPVDEPLKELPKGQKFVYVQCGVPECAVIAEGAKEAAAALGVELTVIPAGGTATSISQAFESAAQLKPAVVYEDAIDPVLWPKPFKELKAQGTPIVAETIPESSGEGMVVFNSSERFSHTGKLMAAYVAAKAEGATHAVFYWPPDYTVFKGEAETFKKELTRLCPECTAELVTAPSTTIGKELPSRVVSYLQQNPETNWVGFAFGSMVQGVPEALGAAGLSAETISQAGGEPNWQYLKEGKQTVDLSGDIQIEAWVAMDIAARLATGQELPKTELNGSTPQQFLTQEEITFDPAGGFHPFPDYQATFKKLWGVN